MNNLQKMGGISAFLLALAYITGIAMFVTVLDPGEVLNAEERIAFLIGKKQSMYLTMLFIYVISGFALIVLVEALKDIFKKEIPALNSLTSVFGYLWGGILIAGGMIFLVGLETVIDLYGSSPERAGIIWEVIGVVFEGLGGGIETVGGLWVLLISIGALKVGIFSKLLNYLGIVVGIAGILTILPMFESLTMVFGLGQIPWFIWVGIILLRNKDRLENAV